ncbi:MAG TPA: calcium-binding protein, partial [Allosphingosinicella sp.]|nr:calcium-binding protein [Allosphingosinicella sp.]
MVNFVHRFGSEITPHATTVGYQFFHKTSALASGGFVTVWMEQNGDGSGYSIRGQRFDNLGAKVGAEFQANSTVGLDQQEPFVIGLASGGFAVTWIHTHPAVEEGGDGQSSSIRGRVFGADGVALGNDFLVNTSPWGDQRDPSIVALPDGGFVATWTGVLYSASFTEIVAQRFDSTGSKVGPETRVNSTFDGSQTQSNGAPLAGGGYVIVWQQSNGTFDSYDVLGQRFDSAGDPVGYEFLLPASSVNGQNPSLQGLPDVAALSNGGFVATWQHYDPVSQRYQAVAQMFDSGGLRIGGELIATNPANAPNEISVTGLSWGGFVVAWDDVAGNGSSERAQLFNSDGSRLGDQFQINASAADYNSRVDLATIAGDRIVAVWQNANPDVKAQILTTGIYGDSGANALQGTALDDLIFGFDGDDILTGGAGTDRLDGGAGVDTADYALETGGGGIIVNLSGGAVYRFNQTAIQPGQALDSYGNVETLVGVENFRTGSGDDYVLGDAGANRFETGGGRDILVGGGGADYLAGGGGDDQYYVYAADSATFEDAIVELADGGFDQIRTTLASFSLAGLPEVESLFGIANIAFTLTGNDRDNYIIGNNSADTLEGGLGNDKLEGGGGNDTMRGGLGDDEYIVTEIGDVVEENSGEGIDLVWTTLATYSLAGTNIENLFAFSTIAHDFRGNSGDNVITGGAGNDVLRLYDGGNDTVLGGAGNDNIFFIGALTSADVVDGGDGGDTLVLQGPYGAITLTANITRIEGVSFLAGSNTAFGEPGTNRYDYVLTINDANFAAGVQAKINGAALLEGEDFTFN